MSEYPADTEADNVIQVDVPSRVIWTHWFIIQKNFNPTSVSHSLGMLKWFIAYSPHQDCKHLAAAMLRRHESNVNRALREA